MLNITICDDDAVTRAYLSRLAQRILPGSVIREYGSGENLLEDRKPCDILLMDIQFTGRGCGMDGVQTVKQLYARSEGQGPILIFITAFDDYVFDAFDLYAFQYLMKPVNEHKFERVLLNAARECTTPARQEAVFFHKKDQHIKLYPANVSYVESYLRKVIIHTDAEVLEVYATMDEMKKKLGDSFFRCHRGYLVNMEKIRSYTKDFIRLEDGTEIIMSKQKYSGFVQAYLQFFNR